VHAAQSARQVRVIGEAAVSRDLRNGAVPIEDRFDRLGKPQIQPVLTEGQSRLLSKDPTEMKR
jgi:hypothetical protein